MADSKAYRTWLARIHSGTFSHAQCRAWCRTVYAIAIGERDDYGQRSNLTENEAQRLREQFPGTGISLESEHTAKGLAWIREKRNADQLPAWATECFERFTFTGRAYDLNEERNGSYRRAYVPIWRIHATDGRWLDYCAAAWQSGATGPRVLRQSADNGILA